MEKTEEVASVLPELLEGPSAAVCGTIGSSVDVDNNNSVGEDLNNAELHVDDQNIVDEYEASEVCSKDEEATACALLGEASAVSQFSCPNPILNQILDENGGMILQKTSDNSLDSSKISSVITLAVTDDGASNYPSADVSKNTEATKKSDQECLFYPENFNMCPVSDKPLTSIVENNSANATDAVTDLTIFSESDIDLTRGSLNPFLTEETLSTCILETTPMLSPEKDISLSVQFSSSSTDVMQHNNPFLCVAPESPVEIYPAEWCQHCGVLAKTCTEDQKSSSSTSRILDHLPDCTHFVVIDEKSSQRKEALSKSASNPGVSADQSMDDSADPGNSYDSSTCVSESPVEAPSEETQETDEVILENECDRLASLDTDVFKMEDLDEPPDLNAGNVSSPDLSTGNFIQNFNFSDAVLDRQTNELQSGIIAKTESNTMGEVGEDKEAKVFCSDLLTKQKNIAPISANTKISPTSPNFDSSVDENTSKVEVSALTMSHSGISTMPHTAANAEFATAILNSQDYESSCLNISSPNSPSILSNSLGLNEISEDLLNNSKFSASTSQKAHSKNDDSCGPSPEPSETIGISCGFSVLFEKCKNRRDFSSVPHTKSDSFNSPENARSIVSTVEKVSSHLEECAISDTPLYVPDSQISNNVLASNISGGHRITEDVQYSPSTISEPSASSLRNLPAPERKFGILGSPRNISTLEEAARFADKNKSKYRCENSSQESSVEKMSHIREQDKAIATSAPCSPVPATLRTASVAGIFQRKRKLNSCVRRRVSFPENDMHLITSYLEPVDPWERMKRSVNSDEILDAYTNSCNIHGCQPLPIVLSQICALPLNIPGRVECFSLRGSKLDLNQCEGLEEIFKRVQFISIDLENCSLTDDTVIPLVDMIEFYDSATQLNISGNNLISLRGWYACTRMIKKNQSIRALNARNTNLNESHMPVLGKALKMGSRLHTLHLENCNLSGRPLIVLTAALKLNDTLLKLYLADNSLGSSDCIQIGNLMRANMTLKLLDLRNNNLQDAGCAHLCEGIADQTKNKMTDASSADWKNNYKIGLNSLVLWNNHMTVSSAKYLAAMMLATTSIETLNIGRNSVSNDGAARLKEVLLRNKSLKRLYLHATKIGDEGAVALAEFIAESKNIERIDLRENSIKVAGLMALAHALKHNSSMVQMDLDSNPRSEPMEELAEKHVSLLLEIKDYSRRNRTLAHNKISAGCRENDVEDYYHDPDFRKLSLSSEIDGSQTLEVPVVAPPVNSCKAVNIAHSNTNYSEEHRKYRSPSPSPCASPIPSPSLSPTPPSPSKNRFKVFKVTSSSSPTIPCLVTSNPIYAGGTVKTSLTAANSHNLSSSAPISSPPTAAISTTSRPVFHHPQPTSRNRFLSGGGGSRFTVTKVTDHFSHSPISKSKSLSLPQIPQEDSSDKKEPSSPKIIISSPAKVERGFSLEESVSSLNNSSSEDHQANQSISSTSEKNRSDSSESDEVFVDSLSTQCENSSACLRVTKSSENCALSPSSRTRRDLTDSGFLEESAVDFEDALPNLPNKSGRDSDRDSLFSNASDGHSPLTPLPPHGQSLAPTSSSSSAVNTKSEDTGLKKDTNSTSNVITFSQTDMSASIRKAQSSGNSFTGDMNLRCSETVAHDKRAPLASIENGSFDTDSEDSELTTQSSDSTHSDEVRITSAEATVAPLAAWGDGAKILLSSQASDSPTLPENDIKDGCLALVEVTETSAQLDV